MKFTSLLTFCAALASARITCEVDKTKHPGALQLEVGQKRPLLLFLNCKDERDVEYLDYGLLTVDCGLAREDGNANWAPIFGTNTVAVGFNRPCFTIPSKFNLPIEAAHRNKQMECQIKESMNLDGHAHSIYINLV